MTRCMIPVWEAEDRDVLAAALESLLGSFCETELFDVVEVRLSLSLSLDCLTNTKERNEHLSLSLSIVHVMMRYCTQRAVLYTHTHSVYTRVKLFIDPDVWLRV